MCKTTTLQIKPKKIKTVTKSAKRVRFGNASKKVFHQRLSHNEKSVIWYSGRDYKAMNKEVHYNLKQELYYEFNPYDTERTWRGLEHIREGVPQAKLERRRHYMRSFLHLHRQVGVKDPEQLRAFAATQSDVDQIRAEQFGQYDAYEASIVYYEERIAEESEEFYKEFSDIPKSKCIKPVQTIIMTTIA